MIVTVRDVFEADIYLLCCSEGGQTELKSQDFLKTKSGVYQLPVWLNLVFFVLFAGWEDGNIVIERATQHVVVIGSF